MASEFSENEVTVRRLASVVEGVWGKVIEVTNTKAPLDSPALTGTPTVPTADTSDDSYQIANTSFVNTAVSRGIAENDAMTYKGAIPGGSTGAYGALTPAADKGHTYKVSTAGKINGVKVEVGDMLICNADGTLASTSDNYTTVVANWDVIQTNLDGAVSGPSSSTDSHIVLFDGVTGKTVKDSGKVLADFATADHVHGSITNDGKIGSVTGLSVVTGSAGAVTTANLTTADPAASGNALAFIDSVSQDSKGKITATKKNVPVDSTYSSSGTNPVNGTAVADAIGTLGVPEIGGDGKIITTISQSNGIISATAVDKTDILPSPDADDTIFTGSSDGTTDWTPVVKSTWGTALTDGTDVLVDENGTAIMDENATDLWTTFKGVGFGAERAAADIEGRLIHETYATKSEVSGDVSDIIGTLDAEVTSSDGTNVQVRVTETDGKVTAVSVVTDNTENRNNKVSSFQSTTDDSHYPSEKLVKDSLDGKKDKQEAVTVSGLGVTKTLTALSQDANGVISATAMDIDYPTVVFDYDTVTYAQVYAALSADKIPVVRKYSTTGLTYYTDYVYLNNGGTSGSGYVRFFHINVNVKVGQNPVTQVRVVDVNESGTSTANNYNLDVITNKVGSINTSGSNVNVDTWHYPSTQALVNYVDSYVGNYVSSTSVRFDASQNLTDAQKSQARTNIGAQSQLTEMSDQEVADILNILT